MLEAEATTEEASLAEAGGSHGASGNIAGSLVEHDVDLQCHRPYQMLFSIYAFFLYQKTYVMLLIV